MSKSPTRDEFAEQEGTVFQLILSPEESIDLELIKVDEVRDMPPYVSFSVVFLARRDCDLPSQIYKLKHKAIGEIELFLSPFWKDENGLKLESVFNQAAESKLD